MKNNNLKTIALVTLTVVGASLFTSNAEAQWRWGGWGHQASHGPSCSSSRIDLRREAQNVDRLANQMVCQFSREMNPRCGCSIALLNHLRKTAGLTRNLVIASNGTCKCTFKKAACALNDSMPCVVKQSRKVRYLSCSMKDNIERTVRLANRIHKNSDLFVPRNTYNTYNNRRPAPTPVYGRPVNNGHHGHSHTAIQQDPRSLIFSLLRNRF